MATSFGKSKQPKGPSAADMLRLYEENETSLNYHLATMKTAALSELTQQWFRDNPLTLKTMENWGRVMCPYLERTASSMDTEEALPVADYLNFVSTLDAKQLIPNVVDTRSRRYDTFCNVIDTLVPYSTVDVSRAAVLQRYGSR